MGLFTHDIKTMDDLFVHTLRDIYYAEHQITKALPQMIDKASNPKLREAFSEHLAETEGQIARLEQVFKQHGVEAKGVTCEAIDGILSEAESVTKEAKDDEVRDAAMLAAAQAVEHYEIARYGTLVAWAHLLGRPDCAAPLAETLKEEEAADSKLTDVAQSVVNQRAAA